ncbi:hypothetical protein KUCAC02_005658 [Chaenocephalus aceratus]|uniref:Uncharacterized protein n=1 Tax=Chaenocephalus aceratus TaxID=36190 RepID=A0ACB9WPI8_CHAAC|nr:hypothetical protein KUCAC02_005658 [Chaenocephalus aceratus]
MPSVQRQLTGYKNANALRQTGSILSICAKWQPRQHNLQEPIRPPSSEGKHPGGPVTDGEEHEVHEAYLRED